MDKYKCTTYWGVPTLLREDGEYMHNVKSVRVTIFGQRCYGELVGVGSERSIGHGAGSGYSEAGIKILNTIIIPQEFIPMDLIEAD